MHHGKSICYFTCLYDVLLGKFLFDWIWGIDIQCILEYIISLMTQCIMRIMHCGKIRSNALFEISQKHHLRFIPTSIGNYSFCNVVTSHLIWITDKKSVDYPISLSSFKQSMAVRSDHVFLKYLLVSCESFTASSGREVILIIIFIFWGRRFFIRFFWIFVHVVPLGYRAIPLDEAKLHNCNNILLKFMHPLHFHYVNLK